MARPRTIKLADGGEVILKNISKERCDEITSLLTAVKPLVDIKVQTEPEPVLTEFVNVHSNVIETPMVDGKLTNVAVGTSHKDNVYSVVVIKYNPFTKQAIVDSVKPAGHSKAEARSKFATTAMELGLV